MIVLYIFLALVGLIIATLLCPVKIKISLKEEISINVRYLFLVYDFFKVRKNKKQKPKINKNKQKNQLFEKDYFKKLVKEKGFVSAIVEICSYATLVIKKFLGLLHHVKISKLNLKICVGNEDAAKAGIQHGLVCAAVYPCLGFASSVMKIKKQTLQINTDFNDNSNDIEFCAKLNLIPLFAIISLISFVLDFIKLKESYSNKPKEEAKNVRR